MKADIIHQFPEHHIPFDVFSAVTNVDGLVKRLVDKLNLYVQQNGREFHTNEREMRAGINYIMSIRKPPTVKSYWECGQFIGNEAIRNVMGRSRFEDILQNLHFAVTKVTNSGLLSTILIRVLIILFQMMILKTLTSVW